MVIPFRIAIYLFSDPLYMSTQYVAECCTILIFLSIIDIYNDQAWHRSISSLFWSTFLDTEMHWGVEGRSLK